MTLNLVVHVVHTKSNEMKNKNTTLPNNNTLYSNIIFVVYGLSLVSPWLLGGVRVAHLFDFLHCVVVFFFVLWSMLPVSLDCPFFSFFCHNLNEIFSYKLVKLPGKFMCYLISLYLPAFWSPMMMMCVSDDDCGSSENSSSNVEDLPPIC